MVATPGYLRADYEAFKQRSRVRHCRKYRVEDEGLIVSMGVRRLLIPLFAG